MPLYVYQVIEADGSAGEVFEVLQSFDEPHPDPPSRERQAGLPAAERSQHAAQVRHRQPQ